MDSDWFQSSQIVSKDIETIKSTQETSGNQLPTSIPTPFARLDLVRSAFEIINNKRQLEGTTDYHKLVSDALDIGQILFNYDIHGKDLELLVWDSKNQISSLKNSPDKGHRKLADTLKLYLEQDREKFNFNAFDRFYILKYKNKVIGGISPMTLFFAAPFEQKKYPVEIRFGNDVMLDFEYYPLFKREKSYIKYLFAIASQPGFANYFPELTEYIHQNISYLDAHNRELAQEIRNINPQDYLNNLTDLTLSDSINNLVEVFGISLKKNVYNPWDIDSDFRIRTSKKIAVNGEEVTPLALPVEQFNRSFRYVDEKWDP